MSAHTWEPFSAFIAQVEEMCLRLGWAFLLSLLAIGGSIRFTPLVQRQGFSKIE